MLIKSQFMNMIIEIQVKINTFYIKYLETFKK